MNRKLFSIALLSFLLSACATTVPLTTEEVRQRYQNFTQLSHELAGAEQKELEVLSPENYRRAKETYEKAYQLGQSGDDKADEIAERGLLWAKNAVISADKSRELLADVLTARQKALAVDADKLMSVQYEKANDQLIKLTKLVEKDELAKVKAERLKLANEFSSLELAALKSTTVETARATIKQAEELGVTKHAPKSMARAKSEMKLALDLLEMDRVDYAKADQHVKNAKWWAERAVAISDIIKSYENADYTKEDILLWYQDQLKTALAPVSANLPFNQSNRNLIQGVKSDLANLVTSNEKLAQQNEELTASYQQLLATAQQQEKALQSKISKTKEEATKEDRKFAFVQTLFDEKEAEVYRQKDDVLIRAQGFKFDTGKTEIDSSNFALMQKIIRTIQEYPDSKIVVSGHTDSTGGADINQQISEERAAKVAKFLIDVGQLDPARIQFRGYGESKPLASNETTEGRAANRRIEISLLN